MNKSVAKYVRGRVLYIQITNRCNLSCRHCMYDCGPEGDDMTLDTFKQALEFGKFHHVENIALGGGEPTLHPEFFKMLLLALSADFKRVELTTNGQDVEATKLLIGLAERHHLWLRVSDDEFHPPVHPEIQKCIDATVLGAAWYSTNKPNAKVPGSVQFKGRASNPESGIPADRLIITTCSKHPCVIVDPNGMLIPCDCESASFMGRVQQPNSWNDMPEIDFHWFECTITRMFRIYGNRFTLHFPTANEIQLQPKVHADDIVLELIKRNKSTRYIFNSATNEYIDFLTLQPVTERSLKSDLHGIMTYIGQALALQERQQK